MEKRRILLATPIYPPEIGGPATYTKELSEKLGNDFNITILTYGKKATAPVFPNTKLSVVNKNSPMLIRLFLYTLQAIRLARKADVIYVQNAVASGFPVALATYLVKRPFIIKFVGDEAWERATQRKETEKFLEDFLKKPEGGTWVKTLMKIEGFVLRRASLVTTPSAYLRDLLIQTYSVKPENIITNYNASENEERKVPFDLVKKEHQICATARLTAWKGIDGILKAVAILKNTYPDVMAVIAGDGPELGNLKNLAKELQVEKYVKFLGRVSRDETYKIRKESAVYILNSTYEGLPHTALTSFQANIPIIATNIAGTNEAVYDNESGLLIPPNDPDALARAVTRLFEDKRLAENLIQGGQKILNKKFTWETHIENLKGFFNKVSRT